MYKRQGQRCSCARRLILPDTPFGDEVIQGVINLINKVKIGPYDHDDVFMGPVVNESAAIAVITFQDTLLKQGARPLRTSEPLALGNAFVTPGLIDITGTETRDTEVFGPLLQVKRVNTLEDAIESANQTKYGLAGGVICDNASVWDEIHQDIHAGIVNWNRPTTGASSALPFGGPGHSGNFRPGAYYAADYCAWPQASQLSNKAKALPLKGMLSKGSKKQDDLSLP